MVRQVTVWETDTGERFETKREAEESEQRRNRIGAIEDVISLCVSEAGFDFDSNEIEIIARMIHGEWKALVKAMGGMSKPAAELRSDAERKAAELNKAAK